MFVHTGGRVSVVDTHRHCGVNSTWVATCDSFGDAASWIFDSCGLLPAMACARVAMAVTLVTLVPDHSPVDDIEMTDATGPRLGGSPSGIVADDVSVAPDARDESVARSVPASPVPEPAGFLHTMCPSPESMGAVWSTASAAAISSQSPDSEPDLPAPKEWLPLPPLLPYQELVVQTVHPDGVPRCLVDHPVGSGKTRTMLHVLQNFKDDPRPKLIFFPTPSVCRNFYGELIKWPNHYRDFFAKSDPEAAVLAAGTLDLHLAQPQLWDPCCLAPGVIDEVIARARAALQLKNGIRSGHMTVPSGHYYLAGAALFAPENQQAPVLGEQQYPDYTLHVTKSFPLTIL